MNCGFQTYFYNKVPAHAQELFRPGPNEDPKKWEAALKVKPGPGYVPCLCAGFQGIGLRVASQTRNLALINTMAHDVNTRLNSLIHAHEVNTSVRILEARRKHAVLKRRCLVLATKVQILRNRGYALGGDEEVLKEKLLALERDTMDNRLDARQEEIWARMVTVHERVRLLKAELERNTQPVEQLMDADTTKRAQKVRRMRPING